MREGMSHSGLSSPFFRPFWITLVAQAIFVLSVLLLVYVLPYEWAADVGLRVFLFVYFPVVYLLALILPPGGHSDFYLHFLIAVAACGMLLYSTGFGVLGKYGARELFRDKW